MGYKNIHIYAFIAKNDRLRASFLDCLNFKRITVDLGIRYDSPRETFDRINRNISGWFEEDHKNRIFVDIFPKTSKWLNESKDMKIQILYEFLNCYSTEHSRSLNPKGRIILFLHDTSDENSFIINSINLEEVPEHVSIYYYVNCEDPDKTCCTALNGKKKVKRVMFTNDCKDELYLRKKIQQRKTKKRTQKKTWQLEEKKYYDIEPFLSDYGSTKCIEPPCFDFTGTIFGSDYKPTTYEEIICDYSGINNNDELVENLKTLTDQLNIFEKNAPPELFTELDFLRKILIRHAEENKFIDKITRITKRTTLLLITLNDNSAEIISIKNEFIAYKNECNLTSTPHEIAKIIAAIAITGIACVAGGWGGLMVAGTIGLVIGSTALGVTALIKTRQLLFKPPDVEQQVININNKVHNIY